MYQFRLFFAQYDILSYVPARTCTVSFTGPDGIRHSVNVQAETLYEAVVLAIRAFREHDCAPGAGSDLDVEARSPGVTHTVSMAKVQTWLRVVRQEPERQNHEGAAEGIARVLTDLGSLRRFADYTANWISDAASMTARLRQLIWSTQMVHSASRASVECRFLYGVTRSVVLGRSPGGSEEKIGAAS